MLTNPLFLWKVAYVGVVLASFLVPLAAPHHLTNLTNHNLFHSISFGILCSQLVEYLALQIPMVARVALSAIG
jgi:hypothetical protein